MKGKKIFVIGDVVLLIMLSVSPVVSSIKVKTTNCDPVGVRVNGCKYNKHVFDNLVGKVEYEIDYNLFPPFGAIDISLYN